LYELNETTYHIFNIFYLRYDKDNDNVVNNKFLENNLILLG